MVPGTLRILKFLGAQVLSKWACGTQGCVQSEDCITNLQIMHRSTDQYNVIFILLSPPKHVTCLLWCEYALSFKSFYLCSSPQIIFIGYFRAGTVFSLPRWKSLPFTVTLKYFLIMEWYLVCSKINFSMTPPQYCYYTKHSEPFTCIYLMSVFFSSFIHTSLIELKAKSSLPGGFCPFTCNGNRQSPQTGVFWGG